MSPPPRPPTLRESATPDGLTLRPHHPQDSEALLAQGNDAQTRRWTTVPDPYTREDAAEFLARRIHEGHDRDDRDDRDDGVDTDDTDVGDVGRDGRLSFAVELNGAYAGTVDLRCGPPGAAAVTYVIAPWARGHDLTERALRLLLPWSVRALDLQVVSWQAAVGNWAARRAAWSVGFRIDGRTRGLMVQRGNVVETWQGAWRRGQPLYPAHAWLESPVLTAGSARLRPLRSEDARAIAEACSDALSQYWLPLLPSPYTLTDAHEHLLGTAEDQACGRALYWAVTDIRREELLLGEIGLQVRRAGRHGEVGYWAHPDGRSRGLTSDGVALAVRHALLPAEDGGLGLDRVLLRAADGNTASQRIARRIGFRPSGVDRHGERLRDGTVRDMLRFDILARECP